MGIIPKLIILSEQLRGNNFELIGEKYICGRLDNCDITLKDPTVSSRHCEFIKKDNTYVLRDLNSTNGTRVNNVPISEQELKSSDILQVGGIEILFDSEDKSVSTAIKTQTGISLEGTQVGISTVKKMENFNPFAQKKGNEKMKHALIVGVLVLLAVIVLLLIAYIVYQLFFKNKGGTAFVPGLRQIAEYCLVAARI
jgi:pSer/pThr/pTyr-binding forkhead associated (FHA) protein